MGVLSRFIRQTLMKRFLTLFLLLSMCVIATARIMRTWSYQQMYDKADFVVIAKPVSTEESKEKETLPDIAPRIDVVGISTLFDICTVMKGESSTNKFLLHHYRLAKPKELLKNGPSLVAFDTNQHNSFLLFLIREADGRFAPVTGQTDPGMFSVLKLEGAAQ